MKKIALAAALTLAAALPAAAGNVEVFVAPEVVVEEPQGGSNAGFVVPLIALVVVAAGVAIASDN